MWMFSDVFLKLTIFRGESDVMVQELSELHHHVRVAGIWKVLRADVFKKNKQRKQKHANTIGHELSIMPHIKQTNKTNH